LIVQRVALQKFALSAQKHSHHPDFPVSDLARYQYPHDLNFIIGRAVTFEMRNDYLCRRTVDVWKIRLEEPL
jgi:hypothetical protein